MQLPTDLQTYIHQSKYARFIDELGRRENWTETVHRYLSFFSERNPDILTPELEEELCDAITNLEIMPSMRALMTAGLALDRDNVAGYNCAYVAIDDVRAFDEAMYILLCGTGVGYSVERQFINQLPVVGDAQAVSDDKYLEFPNCSVDEDISFLDILTNTIIVKDTKTGWASAVRCLILELYKGNFNVQWDLSLIRPAGARLKTFGGRASGPEPLDGAMRFIREVFSADGVLGRRLSSIECHDIMCVLAESVVVGGVRRSAMISLSNLSDGRMRDAKKGDWHKKENQPYRALANNSVCYTEKPDIGAFMKEWVSLYDSKSGERGIFSRCAASKLAQRSGRRRDYAFFGTNPCAEIILRSKEFCNLSEVIVRPEDTLADLTAKVRLATILGTLQATLTDFRYLRDEWRTNCEEERLLGVSLTGIYDHLALTGDMGKELLAVWLKELKDVAIETNRDIAEALGINQAAAITCVKPSGTVSQLCNTSSGIHPRRGKYYLRRYRADIKDPLAGFMQSAGIPSEPAIGKEDSTLIFTFPIKAPKHSTVIKDITALEHLELWKIYQLHWCEHKPSVTINLKESEWMEVGAWVYENWDIMSGVSFLPMSDHVYQQAPEEEITEEVYNKWLERMPSEVNWEAFVEEGDNTTGSQEYACVGNKCEL